MGESKFNYEVPEEFEIESIAIDNAITYRERFPFGRHNKCRSFINDNEKDYEITKSKSNICFSPGIIEFYYPIICRFIPLWSGIILSRVNTKENSTTTDSDASVENCFRIVKYSILIPNELKIRYSRLRLIGPLVNRTIRLIGPFSPGRNLIHD